MEKIPCVYIMANKRNGTIYTGVTSSIQHRVWQHRSGLIDGFTKRHGLTQLVYFEFFASFPEAIEREKQIKNWKRSWKLSLIEYENPNWGDLFPVLFE